MTIHYRRSALTSIGVVAFAVALLFAVSCSGTRPRQPAPEPQPEADPRPLPRQPVPEPTFDRGDHEHPEAARSVAAKARSLLGRPYRYGGGNPSGFDCSGFTLFVFDSAGIKLPRTTAQQATTGRWVAPDELRTGDLVFFGVDRKTPFHVGLVVSAPGRPLRMIHASTSRGVIETEILSDSYWLPRLKFGRRYIVGE